MHTQFIHILEAYCTTLGKPLSWLVEQAEIKPAAFNNWKNGFRNPSLDSISRMALILKNQGANIWTPKQLIPVGLVFSAGDATTANCNIAHLLNLHAIAPPQVYNDPRFELSKMTVLNTINGSNPNTKNLQKWVKVFQLLNIGKIETPLDLVYFPIPWGETPDSYIQIRGKIKLI